MSTVMIVDDSTDSRAFCELIAGMLNMKVEIAENVDEALAAIDGGVTPDLILLDLMMPGRGPGELVKRIKSDPQLAHTRVVLMSAMREIHEMAAVMGADDAIMKPLDLARFTQELRPFAPVDKTA